MMSRGEGAAAQRDAGAGERGGHLALLCLTALGIVYGDIGTSPLYAIRECFHGDYGIVPSRANVLGVLSLVSGRCWSS
jgi:KUP system potassium uptake protein